MRALLTTLTLLACLLSFTTSTQAQTPSPDDTLRAFRIVEKHIREWTLPTEGVAKTTENTDAPKAVGACITLKLRGEVIARGTAWSGAIAGPEAFSNDVLRRAILAAMQQADPKLGVPNDAMRDAAIKLVTPDILISVELAGPLSVVEFNTWEDAELTLRPGLDGVATRIGGEAGAKQGTLHAIFPSQMMLGNMLPHRAMGAVASKVMGEGGAAAALDDPKKLRESSGVRMYRFRTSQVVQACGDATPAILNRGLRVLSPSAAMTRAELVAMANVTAARLLNSSGGLSIEERLLARLVLDQYFGSAFMDRGAIAKLRQANEAFSLTSICQGIQTSELPTHTLALASLCDWGADRPLRRAFLLSQTRSRIERVERPPAQRALIVLADVHVHDALASESRCMTYADGVEQGQIQHVQDAFTATPQANLVSAMPWLGLASVAAAHDRDGIPAAIALRQMRSDCWKHQLSITDATEDTLDMPGGIIFTAGDGKGGGNPYPTWQCVRPLAFIATMLRDPRLTEPNERPEQIVRLMQAARFLRQIQVDEASAWMYPDPKLAIGGIRASTWDNSLPVDATSMTLLFVVELIKSLDDLSAAKNAPAPTAAPASQPDSAPPTTPK